MMLGVNEQSLLVGFLQLKNWDTYSAPNPCLWIFVCKNHTLEIAMSSLLCLLHTVWF